MAETTTTIAHDSRRPFDRTARAALVAELPVSLRQVYATVMRETLAAGAPISPNALVVVLSVLDESSEAPLEFRVEQVQQMLWHSIGSFCDDAGLQTPLQCAEALFATLAITTGDDRFPTGGDEPSKLFEALRELSLAV